MLPAVIRLIPRCFFGGAPARLIYSCRLDALLTLYDGKNVMVRARDSKAFNPGMTQER
jgi:hypothetical protein